MTMVFEDVGSGDSLGVNNVYSLCRRLHRRVSDIVTWTDLRLGGIGRVDRVILIDVHFKN